MDFDQVLEILLYVLPILAGLVGAKVVNQNSLPWHLWNGRIAKLLGLLVSVFDAFRSPKRWVKDVAPDEIKKKVDKVKGGGKKFQAMILLLSLSLFIGCAGWQFTGKTWQETARINIGNVAKVAGSLEEHGMPVLTAVCAELEAEAKEDCVKVGNVALDVFDEIDDYLRMAEIAVALGNENEFDARFKTASDLFREVVAKLGKYGAL